MGLTSDAYQLVKVLHLVTVIVGFGALSLAPLVLRRTGMAGGAVATAWLGLSKAAEIALYAAGVFGVLLILMSEDVWQFSQAWISLAFLIYIAAIGVFHGMKLPALRKLASQAEGSAPSSTDVDAAEAKVALASGIFNVLMVLAVAIMVWKPGA